MTRGVLNEGTGDRMRAPARSAAQCERRVACCAASVAPAASACVLEAQIRQSSIPAPYLATGTLLGYLVAVSVQPACFLLPVASVQEHLILDPASSPCRRHVQVPLSRTTSYHIHKLRPRLCYSCGQWFRRTGSTSVVPCSASLSSHCLHHSLQLARVCCYFDLDQPGRHSRSKVKWVRSYLPPLYPSRSGRQSRPLHCLLYNA